MVGSGSGSGSSYLGWYGEASGSGVGGQFGRNSGLGYGRRPMIEDFKSSSNLDSFQGNFGYGGSMQKKKVGNVVATLSKAKRWGNFSHDLSIISGKRRKMEGINDVGFDGFSHYCSYKLVDEELKANFWKGGLMVRDEHESSNRRGQINDVGFEGKRKEGELMLRDESEKSVVDFLENEFADEEFNCKREEGMGTGRFESFKKYGSNLEVVEEDQKGNTEGKLIVADESEGNVLNDSKDEFSGQGREGGTKDASSKGFKKSGDNKLKDEMLEDEENVAKIGGGVNKIEQCSDTSNGNPIGSAVSSSGTGTVLESLSKKLSSLTCDVGLNNNRLQNERMNDSGRRSIFRDVMLNKPQRHESFRLLDKRKHSRFPDLPSKPDTLRETYGDTEHSRDPFSAALKVVMERATASNEEKDAACSEKPKPGNFTSTTNSKVCQRSKPPSLEDLCMKSFVKNIDTIASLEIMPYLFRHKFTRLLCNSQKMNSHFLNLLVCGSPEEIWLRDCSWLTEDEFIKAFEICDTKNLRVLQLDQCALCVADHVLQLTLCRCANSLPALTTLSLTGTCRLSDIGLNALVSSAPALRCVNLSQCSLVTSDGIGTLANSLQSNLRELYLNDCQGIDAMCVLPALQKLEYLEVLSLENNQTVTDSFLRLFLVISGGHMKELVLKDCMKVTDSSVEVIAENCSGLCALNLVNLLKLTDSALKYLANGCRAMQSLKLGRNPFSDEAIAAFLEVSGESLLELSLNGIKKVGHQTAISLAKRSKRLMELDVSWCRSLSEEDVILILEKCFSLNELKLFGCSQITEKVLDHQLNPKVKIVGTKLSSALENLKAGPDSQAGLMQNYSFSSSLYMVSI